MQTQLHSVGMSKQIQMPCAAVETPSTQDQAQVTLQSELGEHTFI